MTANPDTVRDVTAEEMRRLATWLRNLYGDEASAPRQDIPRALESAAAQVERLTAERDHWQAEASRIDGARMIEVTTVFKRATEAEAARDQQAVMLQDMNTLATALAAERDALIRAAVQALAEMDLPDVVVGLAAYEASCECAPAEAAFRAMCRVLASKIPLPASG